MKRLLTVVLLTVCAAAPEDLIGKMFTFPQETKTDHVKLITPREEFKAITLCLRSFTNLSRNHGLFSLATPAFSNAFLIFKESASDQIEMNIRNKGISFFGEEYKLNTWQSVCASWDGANGLVQIWIDGKPSARRYCSHGTITGHALIMLGQEQDSYGGGFDPQQSFVGMTTDVHMWDFVLSPFLTVSEGVKMHLRTPVEALCILCGNSKRAVTVKTSWLQKTCHPYREADATSSEIQLPTCYQPADSARTHILLRQD
uniref:Pentraxin (PTX) domain-containing protein n=1 Tax=Gadus morhua TaxID=8049 RepID=A0A8C5F3G3_GADMO